MLNKIKKLWANLTGKNEPQNVPPAQGTVDLPVILNATNHPAHFDGFVFIHNLADRAIAGVQADIDRYVANQRKERTRA